MADKTTYIKVDRNILKWRWWHTHNTLIVFLWLLINANVKDHDFENEKIHRGEVATSLKSISNATDLSIQSVRTALSHLKSTGEITSRSRNKYTVITIVNYSMYQDAPTNKTTDNQQTNNKQTTNKQQQYKNNKNNKNGKNIPPKSPTGGLDHSWGSSRMKDRDAGTADDIPEMYREQFDNYQAYWDWRNQ